MKKFFPRHSLTSSELLLLPETSFNLSLFRFKISLFPTDRFLPRTSSGLSQHSINYNILIGKNIAASINGTSLRMPFKCTCLVKVLAAHKMLKKRQVPHIIHFGIIKKAEKPISAHAWLTVESVIVIGGGNLEGFKEIHQIRLD